MAVLFFLQTFLTRESVRAATVNQFPKWLVEKFKWLKVLQYKGVIQNGA